MRRLLAFAAPLLLLAAVPLAGCATTGGAGPLAATEADETALGLAESVYTGIARTYVSVVEAGLVERGSPTAIRVADLDAKIQPVLELARAARKAGDSASAAAYAAQLGPLILELMGLVNTIGGGQ